MPTSRTETITAPDGDTFDGHLVVPDSGTGPGILLIQEIFGVNDYLRLRAGQLAELGYVVLCPDVFWRIERNIDLPHDRESLEKAFGYVQRFGPQVEQGVADLGAALAHLRSLPETEGKVGVMGFCLGGSLAYLTAVYHDPDAAVSYYGSMVEGRLEVADQISCPILFHFGGSDPYIPAEQVDHVRDAVADRAGVEFHVQEAAGHAFDNELAPMFHDPGARQAAWRITVDFLGRKLDSG
jgi:carboxymethylenebutenolidase